MAYKNIKVGSIVAVKFGEEIVHATVTDLLGHESDNWRMGVVVYGSQKGHVPFHINERVK